MKKFLIMKTNSKLLENTRKYRKTKKGLVTNLYHKIKSRNTVGFDLDFLHSFSESKKFERLFLEWEKSNYDKNLKPTLDRISFKKGYEKNNIHWLTWAENRYKQRMEIKLIRAKKVGRFLNNNLIEVYKSVSDAVENFGVSQGNLSSCLNGKRKTAKGFEWKYLEHQKISKSQHVKFCLICNSEFITYSKTQRFCSKKCGSIGNKNAKTIKQSETFTNINTY